MKNLQDLIRSSVQTLKPYTCARNTASNGILLDANENPRGLCNRYPDPYARELKAAYSEFSDIPVENMFAGNGSDEAIDLLFRVFCEPQLDEVIVTEPSYGMYSVSAAINNVGCKTILLTEDFQLDVSAILQAVTQNTKLIFVCSPNNPTGNLMREADILELCDNFSGIVVVDEAYLEFSGAESMALKRGNLVSLRTLSKSWGAAGLRVGFAIATPEIVQAMNKVKPPYNVSRSSQEKAIKVIKKGLSISDILKERERVRRRIEMLGLKVFPSDANFLLVKVPQASGIQKVLQERGVVIRDRSSMPLLADCFRVSIGTRKENDRFLSELEAVLSNEFRIRETAYNKGRSGLKVAFVDRDGVILFEPQDDFQVDSLEKYRILPGVIDGLKRLREKGYILVMVTNQDGRGTPSFPEEKFLLVQNRMIEDLAREGISFDEIFVCPHFPQDNCECRKPKLGLLKEFLAKTPINCAESIVVGDRNSDMQLAKNLGVKGIKTVTNSSFNPKI